MQVANLLSDLTSLSVCGHQEALALVSVHKHIQPDGIQGAVTKDKESDPDLERVKELVDLHYKVKVQYRDYGIDEDLVRAREQVEAVKATMG